MRSVRKDDIIRQRHLPDGVLKAQDKLTLAIVNPECPIRPIRGDKVKKIIFVYAGFSTRRPQTLIDVISRLKCKLRQICDFDYAIPFFDVYSCHMYNFEWLYRS